jgi:hypothetical protein
MKWIYLKDKKPELEQMVLVYKNIDMGGYYKGIYLASYSKIYRGENIFIIDDREINRNNHRTIEEFLCWMPLPSIPEDAIV